MWLGRMGLLLHRDCHVVLTAVPADSNRYRKVSRWDARRDLDIELHHARGVIGGVADTAVIFPVTPSGAVCRSPVMNRTTGQSLPFRSLLTVTGAGTFPTLQAVGFLKRR